MEERIRSGSRLYQISFSLGAPVLEQLRIGKLAFQLFMQMFYYLFRGPWRIREIAYHVNHLGLSSLPIIGISTAFAGVIVTQQIAWHMDQALHTVQMIPGFSGQFIIRELGIAVPALLLIAKVGAAMTAEVGTMKITEQIDALRLLRIEPVSYLVFPRWIASLIFLPCLTFIAVTITLVFALIVAVSSYHFNALEYLNTLRHFIGWMDILGVLVKSFVFGAFIPIISCAYGLRCEAGAQGVGSATTNAVVASTTVLILLEFILTYIFSFALS